MGGGNQAREKKWMNPHDIPVVYVRQRYQLQQLLASRSRARGLRFGERHRNAILPHLATMIDHDENRDVE
jgi:hypothetical protein